MRGKEAPALPDLGQLGITPAHAGKSHAPHWGQEPRRDHPRACGEKHAPLDFLSRTTGSPPRMRGKERQAAPVAQTQGITPAYAGKSILARTACKIYPDHPRVCGEKSVSAVATRSARGSPPRMRGKATIQAVNTASFRITPAYAGKRERKPRLCFCKKDHPRVCGEKNLRCAIRFAS